MPSDMLEELDERLRGHAYRRCAALTAKGDYEILLRLEPVSSLLSVDELLPTSPSELFVARGCRAWRFKCCWNAWGSDLEVWLRSFRETDDKVIFGDRKLPHELRGDVRGVALREG